MKRALQKADKDRTGTLSVNEFTDVLKTLGVDIPSQVAIDLLSELDKELTGMVNYEQFLKKFSS